MKKLFECADVYVENCDWKDMALLKVCLCAVGIMIGVSIPEKRKKCIAVVAGIIFIVSYVPLMMKFIKILIEKCDIRKREY